VDRSQHRHSLLFTGILYAPTKVEIFQYVVGFTSFLFPGLAMSTRQRLLPLHKITGMFIFVVANISVMMGISERAAWHHT
jgi:hypothetical protein